MDALTVISGMDVELKLLKQCAVPFFSAARTSAIIKLILDIKDWNGLISLAIQHSVLPLLYEHLQRADGLEMIPSGIREHLQALHYKCAARNVLLLAELNRVLDLLDKAGLWAMPIKGPLLALSCYGALNRRRFDDLDLLIKKNDILKARDILVHSGYRSFVNLPSAQMRAFVRAGWDVNLRQGEEEYSIDLSTGITPGFFCFKVTEEVIRSHSTEFRHEKRSYPALAPELLLIMLAAHGNYHCWERLVWIADVRAVIETHPAMDFSRLTNLARRLGATRMLQTALRMADEMDNIPDAFCEMISGSNPCRRCAGRPPGRIRFHLSLRERWRDRFCYLFRYFCAPTFSDWQTVHLPSFLNWVYWLIRPFRVLFGAIKKPAH